MKQKNGNGRIVEKKAPLLSVLSVLSFLSVPSFSSAQNFSAAAKGTTAGEFLELGVGGRAMAMGGAYTAVADGADALYWNPAALLRVEHHAATFMHAAYLDSSYYDYAAYAQNLGASGAFGLGAQYLNAGAITETDAGYNNVGSFTPYDLAVSAGYAYKLRGMGTGVLGMANGFSLGGAIKYIRSHVLESAQTAAIDAGVLSPAYLNDKLTLALTVANLGGTLNYGNAPENLPLTFKAGGAYRITPRWLASLDLGLPRDNGPYFAAGTEYVLPIKDDWSLSGRAGYSSQTLNQITGVSGISAGLGFTDKNLDLDYAFAPYGGLGITNRVSVSVRW
ncbi:MAG TPA: PorV/PorQ family protein [Elusimicrobiota bacterium]|nr:PorV/PorQ family protein [Elusimicrobiota bacterium]